MIFIYRITIVIVILFHFSCDIIHTTYHDRESYFAQSTDDIQIAIVSSSNMKNDFLIGVNLAIDRLNSYRVLGKKLCPIYYDDEGDIAKGLKIAKKLEKNHKILAVIGHNKSEVAVAASITYEKEGIIFISPGATKPDLLQNQYKYVFSNTPSSEQMVCRILEYVRKKQLKRIALVFDINNEMSQIANYFKAQSEQYDCHVVISKSYISWSTHFKDIISDIKNVKNVDALFLCGKLPEAGIFIKQARKMLFDKPILSTNYLNSFEFFQIAEDSASNVIVPTYFDPVQSSERNRAFVKLFKNKNGNIPDELAASGYDAVNLLAHAIEESGSFIPGEVASALHFIKNYNGACGNFSINKKGGISEKLIFLKKSDTDMFTYIERELLGRVNIFETIKDFTLRIPIADKIYSIDPRLISDMLSIEIVEQLFLGLTDFNPETYKPVPELAKSWTVNADYTQYTFFLRNDVVWTDNTKVTAHDVKWTILANLNTETQPSPHLSSLFIVKNAKLFNEGKLKDSSHVGLNVINDYQITFQLEKPASYFPSIAGLLVFRPLPMKLIEKYPDTWTRPEKIISNGSYKLAAWKEDLVMILRKNDLYFDASNVSIPEIRYLYVADERLGLEMYHAGEVDILGGNYLQLPTDQIYDLSMNPKYQNQYYKKDDHCVYAFAFNTINYPLDNVWVRKAINAAIDRNRIIQYILDGKQKVANNFTPQLKSCFKGQGAFNPGKAKKYLAKAGFPNGSGFPEITIAFNRSKRHENIARGVKSCLKYYLNIHAKILSLEWEKYLQGITTDNNWHLIRYGICADYLDPNNFLNELFHPDIKDNICRWSNNEFIQFLSAVDTTMNFNKRMHYYCLAEKVLCHKVCAIAPIYFQSSHYLINPRVTNWYHMPLGGQHIRNWSLKP
jgi:ABC-type oligopeptide transport system substrate-binding subunit/ABC-type branched-subunit amino acid transport system substrate-binding protein